MMMNKEIRFIHKKKIEFLRSISLMLNNKKFKFD